MERYRFYSDGAVFFVTFSVVEWLPVFVSGNSCKIMSDSLAFCHDKKGLRINASVVMPTHFHAILFQESFRAMELERVVTDFRKFTGRQLGDFCETHLPRCFSQTFRSAAGADRKRRFWQPSRHPVQVETESFWRTKLDYLHENPSRKGLVARAESWRFSSAKHWLSIDGPPAIGEVESLVPLSAMDW